MGSFLTRATGTGNSFAAQGPSTLLDQNKLGLTNNIAQSQAGFNQAFAGQGNVANQLQAQAQGYGPNPAQMQLQQGTNRAIQQGSGMIASQKGISPALAARLSAQNAAGQSQAAAGQGALMGAQQQQAAQGQLGNIYGQMGQQQAAQQSTLQNALASFNNNQVAMQSNINNVDAGVAAQNASTAGGLAGGVANALGGGAAKSIFGARGGEVPKRMADGGPVMSNWGFYLQPDMDQNGAASFAGKYLNSGASALQSGLSSFKPKFGSSSSPGTTVAGGPGDAMDSSGGTSPGAGLAGDVGMLLAASKGALVPGKAAVSGDSLKNDKVPAMLSPKEIVLPRTVTLSPDAPRKAAEFVAAVQAGHGRKMPMRKAS